MSERDADATAAAGLAVDGDHGDTSMSDGLIQRLSSLGAAEQDMIASLTGQALSEVRLFDARRVGQALEELTKELSDLKLVKPEAPKSMNNLFRTLRLNKVLERLGVDEGFHFGFESARTKIAVLHDVLAEERLAFDRYKASLERMIERMETLINDLAPIMEDVRGFKGADTGPVADIATGRLISLETTERTAVQSLRSLKYARDSCGVVSSGISGVVDAIIPRIEAHMEQVLGMRNLRDTITVLRRKRTGGESTPADRAIEAGRPDDAQEARITEVDIAEMLDEIRKALTGATESVRMVRGVELDLREAEGLLAAHRM